MRIRLPELLDERGWTAYRLAQAVRDRGMTDRTVYRVVQLRGCVRYLDARFLDILCDVFEVEPGDLLERERPYRRKRSG